MKYFEIGLKSTELEYMFAFSPNKRTATSTPFQMKYLAQNFSRLVENIEPQEGLIKKLMASQRMRLKKLLEQTMKISGLRCQR